MKIKILYLLFLLLFVKLQCSAQNDFWTDYFPGYLPYQYKAGIDANDNLNFVLNNESGQQNKFISIDKTGAVIFQQNTSDLALFNCTDSAGNRYLVSYAQPVLRIQKYNSNNVLVWDSPQLLNNAISISNLDQFTFINLTECLITKNGKLVIAGGFKEDTISFNQYALDVFFIDTSNGTILSEYYNLNIDDFCVYTKLQEDDLNNINVLSFSAFWYELGYLRKISQTGILLDEVVLGDNINYTHIFSGFKITPSFIYAGIVEGSGSLSVIKLNKTTLDTLFVSDSLGYWDIVDSFDASDSSFFISYEDLGPAIYAHYNSTGSLVCMDSSSYYDLGYRFFTWKEKSYSARDGFGVIDSSCTFSDCTHPFDISILDLSLQQSTNFSFPYDNYYGKDIVYLCYKNANDVFGIMGFTNETSTNVSGKLYFDSDNNCIADSSEIKISNQLIKIDPLNKLIFTDGNGNYKYKLDTGGYVVSGVPFNPTLSFCPLSINVSILDTYIQYQGNDIGIQDQTGNLQDFSISINQTPLIPGMQSWIYIHAENKLPLPASGIIKLALMPGIYSFNFASLNPDSVSGDNYYWHVDNIDPLNSIVLSASFLVNTGATLRTLVTDTVEIISDQQENYLSNNIDIIQSNIVGSYDPNDKLVIPHGIGSNGTISPTDSILNFKIRFQNTGTFLAFNVKIIDTLDYNLNLSTFEFKSSSHPCILSLLDSNVLQISFNDIMLPDSALDNLLSNGFINFSIKTKPNLPLLTEIRNTAHIYFDFNEPVATNETINTINLIGMNDLKKKEWLKIYPNPAGNNTNLFVSEDIYEWQMDNILGKNVMSGTAKANHTHNLKIGIEDLPPGVYILRVLTGSSYLSSKLVKK